MGPEQARAAARRSCGTVERLKEEYRDTWGYLLESLGRDVHMAIRMLRRNPGFLTIAVLTLTVGIAATTATSAFLYEMLLRPLPYKAPEELVILWTTIPSQGIDQDGSSYPNFLDWKEYSRSFNGMALVSRVDTATLVGAEEPERIRIGQVSADLFPLLGASPLLGRAFTQEEEDRRQRVVVLSYAFWQKRFGGDPKAIGATIDFEEGRSEVIGIMPPEFRLPSKETQLWEPHTVNSYWPQLKVHRPADVYLIFARLRPGVTVAAAQDELTAVSSRMGRQRPDALPGLGVRVVPLREQQTGRKLPVALSLLFAAVMVMLMIACANVAGLLLARGLVREREFALRAAIGAGRRRLLQQLLIESIVLAVIAGALGIAAGRLALRLIATALPLNLPHVEAVYLQPDVVAFSLGLTLITVVVFGMFPALKMSLACPNEALKAGGRSQSAANNRVRRAFVTGELAMAATLLVATGLLLRSFINVQWTDPGFERKRVLKAAVALPPSYDSPRSLAFYREAIERLGSLPGVTSAGAINELFFKYNPDSRITIEGREPPHPDEPAPQLIGDSVDGACFQTMGVPLLRGRLFDQRDVQGAPRVALINETMARQFFPGEDPIGKRFIMGTPEHPEGGGPLTIVGIVGDMHRQGLERPVIAQMFGPHAQFPQGSMDVLVRTSLDPESLRNAFRAQLRKLEKSAVIGPVEVIEEGLSRFGEWRRFETWLLSAFAAVALALAAIGVYGLLQQSVLQRRKEIGVRMALGAQPSDVRRLILYQGLIPVMWGLVLGGFIALAAAPVMRSLLYGVGENDPATLAGTAAVLILTAAAASYLPARRATRMDPVRTLRED
jgi:putative ABC transport system permease protein